MENASKALLIAASVLIVILLIAMGVRIFNSTQGSAEHAEGTMQTTEVAMFNNKFLPYIGTNKNKNDALSLVNIIIANNSSNSVKINLGYNLPTVGTGSTYYNQITRLQNCVNQISKLEANRRLNIRVDGYNSKGYIEKIYITI